MIVKHTFIVSLMLLSSFCSVYSHGKVLDAVTIQSTDPEIHCGVCLARAELNQSYFWLHTSRARCAHKNCCSLVLKGEEFLRKKMSHLIKGSTLSAQNFELFNKERSRILDIIYNQVLPEQNLLSLYDCYTEKGEEGIISAYQKAYNLSLLIRRY